MKIRRFRIYVHDLLKIWLLIVVFALLVSCSDAQNDLLPTEEVRKSGDLLFQDDFSKVPSGWGTWENNEAVVTYEQGGLRILVNQPDFDFWSVSGRRFEDSIVGVNVKRIAGPEDNDFGVICRYQDAENFYMFLVSSDGYYGIGKIKEAQHSLIGIEQLQYTDMVRPEQPEYRLQAECVGSSLKLYVDGTLLLAVTDEDFSSGDVGVLAGAYSTPGVDILFDNFEVRQP